MQGLTRPTIIKDCVMNQDQNVSKTTQELTSFLDDVQPVTSSREIAAAPTQDSGIETTEHDVVRILQRPALIKQGNLSSADLASVFDISFPEALITLNSNKLMKLNYFTYLRASIKVRLVVNSQPFQAGRYYLCFAPFESYSNRGMYAYPANVTGYPGVELDLSAHQSVELKIPYVSPLSHYNLVQGTSTMGELFLRPLSPVTAGTVPSTCGYSLYAWFEDIELSLPTGVPCKTPAAQVLGDFSRLKKKMGFGGSGGGNIDSRESGFISSTARTFARGASYRPVKWLAGAAAGVAESEGFSKPSDEDQPSPIVNLPSRGYTHMDNKDQGLKLAATASNSLPVPKALFSTDQDEMDISYIVSRSCLLFPTRPLGITSTDSGNILWKTSDAVGAVLKRWPVTPSYMGAPTAQNSRAPTLCAYVASLFEYWSGSMEYRISVVKTAFHSGRLRLTYYPGVLLADLANAVPENAYNVVLDLAESSETSVAIPYNNNQTWSSTAVMKNASGVWVPNAESMGYFEITVLNPLLIVSDNVASTVEILVGMSAGKDMRFAVPTTNNICPVVQVHGETQEVEQQEGGNAAVPMFHTRWSKGEGEQLSIGEEILNLRQLTRRFVDVAFLWPMSFWASGSTIAIVPNSSGFIDTGSSVQSISFDTANFGRRLPNAATITTAQTTDLINATVSSSASLSPGTPLNVGDSQPVNLLNLISQLYRFYTGSRRYKFFQGIDTTPALFPVYNGTAVTANAVTSYEQPRKMLTAAISNISTSSAPGYPTASTGVGNFAPSALTHTVRMDLNGVMEVEVPFYNVTPFAVVNSLSSGSTTYGQVNNRKGLTVTRGMNPHMSASQFWGNAATGAAQQRFTTPLQNVMVKTAAGDDFTFGYLVGAPAVQFNPPIFQV